MREHRKPQGGSASTALQRTETPGVYRRGDSYVTTWRQNGRQHKATFSTQSEAENAKAVHDRGGRLPAERVSFEAYAADWIEAYRGRTRRGLSRSTRGDYRRSLELYATPYFGNQGLAEIAPRDVRGYVEHLELLGQAASSVRKNFAPVRALLATAVEDGVMAANPASVIRVVGARTGWEDDETRRALTREELAAFMAALPNEWVPFFRLLVQTGIRISEAVGLTWGDLELNVSTPSVTVRRQIYRGRVGPPKTRYGKRTIPLSSGTARLLTGSARRRSFATTATLCSRRRGAPRSTSRTCGAACCVPPRIVPDCSRSASMSSATRALRCCSKRGAI